MTTSVVHRFSQTRWPPFLSSARRHLRTSATRPRKSRLRPFVAIALGLGALYYADERFNASSLLRTSRTFTTGTLIALDYKINFRPHPPLAESIPALHARTAERISNLIRKNGGLYLKMGQAIALQSAILPPEFQRLFARMFDDAPQNPWADVEQVIRSEFGGRSPKDVFGEIETEARASASVAQVHWARLPDGREVAVKIQKREIEHQIAWDLWAFRAAAYVYSKFFDMPLYTLVPYISERLQLETDFLNEAKNAERTTAYVNAEPHLHGRVHIPQVYKDLTTRRVLTTEWIEGVRVSDKQRLAAPWKGGKGAGTPGCESTPLGDRATRTNWCGPDGTGGLGLHLADVMRIVVDLFSAQIFSWGHVHCDPHPGNIFVRRRSSGEPQIVLLDHGLYIHLSPEFRRQYASFWKALLTFDNATLRATAESWGIGNMDAIASATLMRPYSGGDRTVEHALSDQLSGKDEAQRAFELQQRMQSSMRDMLADERKLPRELIFLGRTNRILQANNQFLGSPVNRVKIMGTWASRALASDPSLPLLARWHNWLAHGVFRLVLLSSDVVFYVSRIRQWLGLGEGMESDMENVMRHVMRNTFGVELNHDIFSG